MKFYFGLSFLFISLWAIGQKETKERLPLPKILEEVETKYEVSFSYNAQIVDNKYGQLPKFSGSLTAVLQSLETTFKIHFKKIDEVTYVINELSLQDVCGFIFDSAQKPIIGATILPLPEKQGAISNNNGYFELKGVNVLDTLHLSYLGYQKLVIPIMDYPLNQCPTFVLKEEKVALKEVVVQDYLVSGVVKQRDGSMQIRPKTLEILSGLGEPDILQSAQLLPGIVSPTETASGIFVRGGTPDQNLVLWDGIKLYNTDHFFGVFSAFNPYVVESLEVSRSGTSAKYGDRIAGVLDIKTSDKIPEKIEGGAGFNLNTLDAFITIPISTNTSIQLSSRRSLTDIYDSPNFQNFSERVFQNTSVVREKELLDSPLATTDENIRFFDAHLKMNIKPSSKDRLKLAALASQNQLDFRLNDPQFPEFSQDDFFTRNIGSSLSWHRQWQSKFSTTFSAYGSFFNLLYDGLRGDSDSTIDRVAQKTNTVEEIGFSVQADWYLNGLFNWGVGYQFFDSSIAYGLQNDDFIEQGNDSNSVNALYGYVDYEKNRWYVKTSLRANHYTNLDAFRLAPMILAEYKLGNNLRLTTSVELRNQSVSQIIEFATQDFGLVNQLWVVADQEAFPILSSQQFTYGFLWKKNGWNLDIEGYKKRIDGITSISNGFSSIENSFANGESSTLGIDVLLKKKWNSYSTFISYTWSDTNFKFDALNNGRKFSGNNDITHSLTWSHSLSLNALELSLGWNLRTGIPFTNAFLENIDDEPDIVLEEVNNLRLPTYHRLDFSALYSFQLSKTANNPKGKVGLSVLNIYGRRNILSREFGFTDALDNEGNPMTLLRTININSLGFTPNLVVRVNF